MHLSAPNPVPLAAAAVAVATAAALAGCSSSSSSSASTASSAAASSAAGRRSTVPGHGDHVQRPGDDQGQAGQDRLALADRHRGPVRGRRRPPGRRRRRRFRLPAGRAGDQAERADPEHRGHRQVQPGRGHRPGEHRRPGHRPDQARHPGADRAGRGHPGRRVRPDRPDRPGHRSPGPGRTDRDLDEDADRRDGQAGRRLASQPDLLLRTECEPLLLGRLVDLHRAGRGPVRPEEYCRCRG